jgi:hypothetical protein
VAEPSPEGGVNEVAEQTPEAAEDNSRELADAVASKVTTTTMPGEGGVVRGVDADLVGRTMTSHSATAMRPSISSLTGRCWRRLTSIVWLS